MFSPFQIDQKTIEKLRLESGILPALSAKPNKNILWACVHLFSGIFLIIFVDLELLLDFFVGLRKSLKFFSDNCCIQT